MNFVSELGGTRVVWVVAGGKWLLLRASAVRKVPDKLCRQNSM